MCVHVPFCREVCNFCNCNIVVTRQYGLAAQYVDMLRREIQWYGEALHDTPLTQSPLKQLYIGGGTPTFLLADELRRLMSGIRDQFGVSTSPDRDYCIEIDPRFFDSEMAQLIKSLGFNRVQFGLEDFNVDVQQATNRKYTGQTVQDAVAAARQAGIKLISIDLLYGLPYQTQASFAATLKQVARLQPTRVFMRHFQFEPATFQTQAQLNEAEIPDSNTLVSLQNLAAEFWLTQGYAPLGAVGFMRNTDPLYNAAEHGILYSFHRGYGSQPFDFQLGIGQSAISRTPSALWQNQRHLRDYTKQVVKQNHSISRGLYLNEDDRARQFVAEKLLCNQSISKRDFEQRWQQPFDDYFADEMAVLNCLKTDNILQNDANSFGLTGSGRWFAAELAALFDSNLAH
ncbi:coproporphyrinogen-III oxidase family protein [Halioxenophilus sp. WMMB6]|uniref:coproporphyrinogen-III oxidase family protein n=1 Tax=Halioxenophilus sp. WMMB6 TaxID=3073815 RepID=UPI00295E9185|nr:radical SAM protein [Halioxenophilus sp. WMMB6]